MSRTLSAGLQAHLAGTAHARANMLRLDLRDGSRLGITDHNKDLDFDLGDGTLAYDSRTGILTSDVALACGLDADNYEVTGPIGETVTLAAVLGGRLDRARARLFQVNWQDLTQGAIKLLAGTVSEARVEGGRFILEVRSDADCFNRSVGRLITNQCDADFGDARCGATPVSVTGTVTAVTDAMRFTLSYGGAYADDYFNKGTVEALTGALAGTLPVEIEDWSAAGSVTLFGPLVEAPGVGDTFTVRQGCGKSRADCKARSNIVNFRGFPEVPGSDQVLRAAIPGEA